MPSIRTSHLFVISSLIAALGAILALQSVAWVFCLALALSFYLLALGLGLGRKGALYLVIVFVAFYILAQQRLDNLLPGQNDLSQVRAAYVKFVGTVVSCRTVERADGFTSVLEVEASKLLQPWSHALCGRVLVRLESDDSSENAPAWGGTYLFSGRLSRPAARIFSFEFDQKRRLRLKGIGCEVSCTDGGLTALSPGNGGRFSSFKEMVEGLGRLRQAIIASHCQALGEERGKLLTSMVLGDRAVDLSDSIKMTFMRVGLSHLLAASGLNLTIIVGAVIFFFRWRRRTRHKTEMTLPQTLAAFVCVLFFVSLAGVSPSVTRATIMCLLLLWSSLVFRKLALGAALAGALFLALLLDPTSILDVGLQLSYGATFGIIYFYPLLSAALPRVTNKLGGWLLALTNVVLAAQIAVLPVQIFCFQKISTLVVPANILAEPLVAPITVMGFLSSFICALTRLLCLAQCQLTSYAWFGAALTLIVSALNWLARSIDLLCGYLIDLLLLLARALSQLPFSYLYLARTPVSSVVFYYLALLCAFVVAFRRPRPAALLALGAAAALTLQSFLLSSALEVLVDSREKLAVVVGAQEQPRLIRWPAAPHLSAATGYLPGFKRDFVRAYLRHLHFVQALGEKDELVPEQPQALSLPANGTFVCRSASWGGLALCRLSLDRGADLSCLASPLPAAAIEKEEAQGVRLYKYKTWGVLCFLWQRVLSGQPLEGTTTGADMRYR